jgi:hypothetical protein
MGATVGRAESTGGIMSEPGLVDVTGHRRSPEATPGQWAGCAPPNKGVCYPADPPTVEEIILVMREAGPRPHTDRAGKGWKRRMVEMDDWGWEHADRWTQHRVQLLIGPLFSWHPDVWTTHVGAVDAGGRQSHRAGFRKRGEESAPMLRSCVSALGLA